jgi:hypothetical protein
MSFDLGASPVDAPYAVALHAAQDRVSHAPPVIRSSRRRSPAAVVDETCQVTEICAYIDRSESAA